MNERQNNLLCLIIEEYIRTSEPVSSQLVAAKYFKDLSSATIRNEMMALEEAGLIFQPHTSSGRVPTTKGYRYYLDHLLTDKKIKNQNQALLAKLIKKSSGERQDLKELAKVLAEISTSAVLVGFAANDVYYTGIANLFRQPEFVERGLAYSISEVIDHLDEIMAKIFAKVDEKIKVLVGEESPFGNLTSVILTKYQWGKNQSLLGFLGPQRMPYQDSIGLINYLKNKTK